MRALIISDVHGYVDMIKEALEKEVSIDVILFSGDITPYKPPYNTYNYLLKALDIAKVYKIKLFVAVPGNVDVADHYNKVRSDIYVNLHNNYKVYENFVFLGFGGSPISPFNTLFEFDDNFIELSLINLYNNLQLTIAKGYSLILVAHTPPYKTKCDIAFNGSNIGSKGIRKFVEITKPLLVVCGHVHESRCVDKINNTTIVNSGPLYKGFYAIANIEKDHVSIFQRKLR